MKLPRLLYAYAAGRGGGASGAMRYSKVFFLATVLVTAAAVCLLAGTGFMDGQLVAVDR